MSDVRRLLFIEDDWIPARPETATAVYRGVIDPDTRDPGQAFAHLFEANGWKVEWRGRISRELHYHSMAHEVIGIAAGSAIFAIGGPKGKRIALDAGDAVLLPAGIAHRQIDGQYGGVFAVGALWGRQVWDVRSDKPDEDEGRRIAGLTCPDRDPVLGGAFRPARTPGA